MTDKYAELREALEKATPGPIVLATSNSWRRILGPRHEPVCVPCVQHDGYVDLSFPNGGCDGPDARLLIAAYNFAAALLAERDALLKAAKAFHNLTIGHPSVIIRAPNADLRDQIAVAGSDLREALQQGEQQ